MTRKPKRKSRKPRETKLAFVCEHAKPGVFVVGDVPTKEIRKFIRWLENAADYLEARG